MQCKISGTLSHFWWSRQFLWHNPVPTSFYFTHASTPPGFDCHLKNVNDSVNTWESWWKSHKLPGPSLVHSSWEQLASWSWVVVLVLVGPCRIFAAFTCPEELWILTDNYFHDRFYCIKHCSERQLKLPFQKTMSKNCFLTGILWYFFLTEYSILDIQDCFKLLFVSFYLTVFLLAVHGDMK